MSLLLTFHAPDAAVWSRPIQSDGLIGRDPAVEFVVPHHSVSRRHARVARLPDSRLRISDLESKNGLRRDGHKVSECVLAPGEWAAVGDVYVQLTELAEAQLARLGEDAERRRTASQLIQRAWREDATLPLLQRSLAAFVELAECQRGYLLLGTGREPLQVLARCDRGASQGAEGMPFDGSQGAVERCLRERRAVYLSPLPESAWLRERASVVRGGVRAIACLPLMIQGALRGALYADTDIAARCFDELDAELLQAFADEAATALAAYLIDQRLAALSDHLAEPS